MTDYWFVDRINSCLVGTLLAGAHVPTMPHPLPIERYWQVWTEIVFVSICHQANWDRLHDAMIEVASKDVLRLHPSRLCSMGVQQFVELFSSGLDSDRMKAAERTKILRCLGKQVEDWPNGNRCDWLRDREMRLSGETGFYAWLNNIPVFAEDPVQKKSRVLVHQLLRYGLIDVIDPQNIAPAVDYHIMRLYVRTARVRPIGETLRERLNEGKKVRIEIVTSLRRAVEEAMHYSSVCAGIRIDELNHIEWQIARSFCVRHQARCESGPLPEKPIDQVVANLSCKSGGGCPLAIGCQGARDPQLRRVVDPQSLRSYY